MGEFHLVKYAGREVELPLRYYGNVGYYAEMAAYGRARLGGEGLFDKRHKSVHRCVIADARGPLQLTVPVAKPHGVERARWSDVALSPHGAWWNVHRVSLESAYGRTPFFEFYIDRFVPFLTAEVMDRFAMVKDLDVAIDAEIRRILLLETDVCADGMCGGEAIEAETRELEPYYQVRGARQGFVRDVSVLDLIFNMGPEAPLYLRSVVRGAGR